MDSWSLNMLLSIDTTHCSNSTVIDIYILQHASPQTSLTDNMYLPLGFGLFKASHTLFRSQLSSRIKFYLTESLVKASNQRYIQTQKKPQNPALNRTKTSNSQIDSNLLTVPVYTKVKVHANIPAQSDSSLLTLHLCEHKFQRDLPTKGIRKEALKTPAVNLKHHKLKRKARKEEKLQYFSCMPTWFAVDRSKLARKCFNLLNKFIRDSYPTPQTPPISGTVTNSHILGF